MMDEEIYNWDGLDVPNDPEPADEPVADYGECGNHGDPNEGIYDHVIPWEAFGTHPDRWYR